MLFDFRWKINSGTNEFIDSNRRPIAGMRHGERKRERVWEHRTHIRWCMLVKKRGICFIKEKVRDKE